MVYMKYILKRVLVLTVTAVVGLSGLSACSGNKNNAIIGEVNNESADFSTKDRTQLSATADGTREMTEAAKALLAINPDTIGWIKIEDTNIDYPVVQRRNMEDGNSYYLERDFNGKTYEYGSIFMDFCDSFDVEGERSSDQIVIYGHNTRFYHMFSQLHKYKKSLDFYKQSPIIELRSNYQTFYYLIFCCMITNVNEEDGPVFIYHSRHYFDEEAEFNNYVSEMRKRSRISADDIDVKYGDQILALSTCSVEFDNSRLVIVGRRLRDGETVESAKALAQTAYDNPDPLYPDRWYRIFGGSYKGE